MAAIVITPPTQEPVSLAQVKQQCRITHALDDALLTGYIASARDYLQVLTRRQFLSATYQWTGTQLPLGTLTLEYSPVQSVSEVATLDTSGVATPLLPEQYLVVLSREPAPVLLLTPVPLATMMRVTYVAGYASLAAMPASLVQAMLLLVGHWYEHRLAVGDARMEKLPYALENLIWINRLPSV